MKPPVFNHKQYTDLEADYMILKAENEQLKAQLSATNNRLKAAVEILKKIAEYNGSLICHCNDILKFANEWRGPGEKGEKDE